MSTTSWSSDKIMKGGSKIFIKEIYARRPIWDLRCHARHNRELVSKLWEEISELLCVPTEKAKKKWKHLRDNFRTELKKTVCGTGDPPKPYQSQWTYFNDLLFLEEQMMRKISGNYGEQFPYRLTFGLTSSKLAEPIVCMTTSGEILTNEEHLLSKHPNIIGHSLFDDSSMHEHFAFSAPHKQEEVPHKQRFNYANEDEDEEEEEEEEMEDADVHTRQRLLGNDRLTNHNTTDLTNDDDYHFMMSLLPYVKSLSLSKKMHLRLRFQELVCDFIYNIKVPNISPGSTKQEPRCTLALNGQMKETKSEQTNTSEMDTQ